MTTDEPEIRPYRDADFDAVVALWQMCGLLVSHNDPARDIAFCRATATAELFVATAGATMAGSVMAGHDGHRGWLYYVAVAPASRGTGLGRRLVDHGERWLSAHGAAKVNLMIRDGNDAVRDFYAAQGYASEPRIVMARFLYDRGDAADPQPPKTKIETRITYLEMRAAPASPLPEPGPPAAVGRLERPSLAFYRFLYDSVGQPWLWYERRLLDDDVLAAIIGDPAVTIDLLTVDGEPAGYAELDARKWPDIELAYFGLRPQFIGRGLGPALLGRAVNDAWARGPRRLWVHTDDLDHPSAKALYERAGFVPYREEHVVIDDPRSLGLCVAAEG